MAVFTRDSQNTDTKFQTELPEALTKARKNPVTRRTFKNLKHCEDKQHCANYVIKRKKKDWGVKNWWSYTSAAPTPLFYLSPHKYNDTRHYCAKTWNILVARYRHTPCPPKLFALYGCWCAEQPNVVAPSRGLYCAVWSPWSGHRGLQTSRHLIFTCGTF
jgi:hypothetical protein